jgi:uroporphyrinogen-III synthase
MNDDKPLLNRVIAVPEARQLDVLASLLERRGATVVRCPLVSIKDAPDGGPVRAWLTRVIATPPDLLIFYTGEGIERLLGFARSARLEGQFVGVLRSARKLTRGPKPKRALNRLELEPELVAAAPTTDGLIETLQNVELAGKRVAVQLYSREQDPKLIDYLHARGAEVDFVAPYVYADAAEAQVQRLRTLARERHLEDALKTGLGRTRIAAVGPVVEAELAEGGFAVDTMPAENFSMKPLVSRLCELLGPAPH